MCGHAGWYAHDGYREFLFFVPFHQLLLIGPVIYFYTQSLLNKDFLFKPDMRWHFMPAAVYLLYALIVAVTDLWLFEEFYFYADGRDKNLAPWYQITGLASMIGYTLGSLRYYYQYRRHIYEMVSFADTIKLKWLQQFLYVFLFILLVRITFHVLFPNWGDFGSKWWYYLIFAVLAYYLAIAGYSNTIRDESYIKGTNKTSCSR